MKTGLQLYSLRNEDMSIPEQVEAAAEAGFDGVELAGLGETSSDKIIEALEENDIEISGAHVPKKELEDSFEETVADYEELGCDRLIIPYMEDSHFKSEEAVESAAEYLSEIGDKAAERGIQLGYHNHEHEFSDIPGRKSTFHYLTECIEGVKIELDIGWASAAGYDPADFIDSFGDKITAIHVKDVKGAYNDAYPVELGNGNVRLSESLENAKNGNVEWAVYEHENLPSVDVLKEENQQIREYIK